MNIESIKTKISLLHSTEDELKRLVFNTKYGREPKERELDGFVYKKILREEMGFVI